MWSFFILCLQVSLFALLFFIFHNFSFHMFNLTISLLMVVVLYKVMIIVAWNGSGNPSSIFEVDVFKKVLSVFITAAILKLGQGNHRVYILLIVFEMFSELSSHWCVLYEWYLSLFL